MDPTDTENTAPSELQRNGAALDPFADDTPVECGIENPDICESCQ